MNKNSVIRDTRKDLPFGLFSFRAGKRACRAGLDRRPYLDRVFMSVAGERGEFAKLAKEWLAGWDSVNINRAEVA